MDSKIVKKLDNFFYPNPSKKFKKGDIILQAGQEPSGVFYIVNGIVRNYWISQEGTEITLNMYKPHTFLPMSWAIANVPNNNFYEAMTSVTTKHVPKDIFYNFCKKNQMSFMICSKEFISAWTVYGCI